MLNLHKYEGAYDAWSSRPNTNTAEIIWIEDHSYGHIHVVVQQGDIDSSLNLIRTYNDTLTYTDYDLIFSSSGHHFSSSGAGSDGSRLTINIDTDSLHYDKWFMMGMNNQGGVIFNIGKK